VEAPHVVNRRDWLHGVARCPECRLPQDAHRDLDDYEQVNSDTPATGAIVTHQRCGATFRVVLTEP